jgi:DNA polymerase III epsilon subunit-like protein
MARHRESRTTWFCVDIECNGPVPGLYDMVSLGAVVVYPGPDQHLVIDPQPFYAELKPVAPRFDARAAAIHGLDQEKLRREGLSHPDFCAALTAWVRSQTRAGTKPGFVGHNAPFDWSFVSWIYASEGLSNPFGYKALCTKALATGALDLHWLDSGKETLSERLSLPAEDMGQKHRADYDALYQAQILVALLDHMADRRSRGA